MVTLLSPSKTQNFETLNRAGTHTQPEFIFDTKELISVLEQMDIEQIQEAMKVSERIAFLNYNRFQDIRFPFTPQHDRQAVLAFRGDVYVGLDAETLTDEELLYAQQTLRIISGFYGILRPLDLIQPYRLEMKTPLKTQRGKNLYQFWGNFLTDYFNTRYSEQILINLASKEYSKAVITKGLKNEVITPTFKEKKGNSYRAVPVYAKKARGKMARYIIKNKIKKPVDLREYNEDGYQYKPLLSTPKEWVFVRDESKKQN